ncbi:MAG: CDGSH iron-sulfur domain-containing protein, partial [Pseudomonadales bacterium]|nr:CDGSH iron-sulfur domain-containing protein [Pseudomonadales bacterium]
MSTPIIFDNKPKKIELEQDQEYYYCTCGRSQNQPFCDGSHKGTGLTPQAFVAEKTGTAVLCLCKHSGNAPYCDGSHKQFSADDVGTELASEPGSEAEKKEELTQKNTIMNWYRVADVNQLDDGETLVVTAGVEEVALTFKDGRYGAINNACPHQGGPLGEGSLDEENCLHCPWHGWAINAFDGSGPNGENVTAYSVEQRDDGIYVELEEEA